jgi:hypothetical protein
VCVSCGDVDVEVDVDVVCVDDVVVPADSLCAISSGLSFPHSKMSIANALHTHVGEELVPALFPSSIGWMTPFISNPWMSDFALFDLCQFARGFPIALHIEVAL